jgi:hypothetical protein
MADSDIIVSLHLVIPFISMVGVQRIHHKLVAINIKVTPQVEKLGHNILYRNLGFNMFLRSFLNSFPPAFQLIKQRKTNI